MISMSRRRAMTSQRFRQKTRWVEFKGLGCPQWGMLGMKSKVRGNLLVCLRQLGPPPTPSILNTEFPHPNLLNKTPCNKSFNHLHCPLQSPRLYLKKNIYEIPPIQLLYSGPLWYSCIKFFSNILVIQRRIWDAFHGRVPTEKTIS